MKTNIINQLFAFIESSPSCYHAVNNVKQALLVQKYKELQENESWHLKKGGKYFVTRNLSSIIAFQIPTEPVGGFHIAASHSDFPAFKIKESPEMEVEKNYIKLNVEKYGGMLMPAWYDRPLSVAGRLLVKEGTTIRTKLVNVDKDLLMIPNLAIHMNREANEGYKYDPQVDLLPLYGDGNAKGMFMKQIAKAAEVEEEAIVGNDLFLYNRMPGTCWGANEEYISCGRLDDLQCAYASLKGFLSARTGTSIPVLCMLDNEEVGSGTKQGAASTFLKDTLQRIAKSLSNDWDEYYTMLSKSFMLSADNAHAVHPNQALKTDPTNRAYMNEGIVIKYNANQRYTTDGVSAAVFKMICEQAQVPCQAFFNRSDMAGGSTLGNISNTQVSLNTVDIGLAQLAMHSPYETAGAKDTEYMIRAMHTFFESKIHCLEDGSYQVTTL